VSETWGSARRERRAMLTSINVAHGAACIYGASLPSSTYPKPVQAPTLKSPSLRPSNLSILRPPHPNHLPILPQDKNNTLPPNRRLRTRNPHSNRRDPELLRPSRRLGLLLRTPGSALPRCHHARRSAEMLRSEQHGAILRPEVRAACDGQVDVEEGGLSQC
jgi:hypothetical protein